MRIVIVFANFDMGIKKKALYSKRYRAFEYECWLLEKCYLIDFLAFFGIIEVYIFLRYAFIW